MLKMENAIDQLIIWSKDLRVLYVEDDISLREEVSIFLSDIFAVIDLATNGQEGLDKLAQNHYHIVITDIRMPVMDGIEMIKQIKVLYPEQPILVTSAHNEIEYLVKLINLGVDNFITKPLQSEHIFKVLHKIVEHINQKKELQRYKEDLVQANALLTKLASAQSLTIDLRTSVLKSYKTALDKACIVSITDTNGFIKDVNDNFCIATGYSKEEVIGKKHRIISHPSTDADLFKDMWKTILAKQTWQGLITNQTKSLSPLHHYTTVVPIIDNQGNILEFVGIIQDLTELYQHNALENKANITQAIELKNEEFLKNIPFASAFIDDHFTITSYNDFFKKSVDNHSDETLLLKLSQQKLSFKELVFFEEMDYFESIEAILNNWPYEGDITFKGSIKTIRYHQEVLIKISVHDDENYLLCIVPQEEFELCCQVQEK